MASIDGGRLSIDRRREDGGALVAEALEQHEPSARAKGVRLERGPGAAPALWCDRDRLLQVLGNLLANAVTSSGEGDVVTVAIAVEGGEACFSVADTGPGIAAEDLPRVFDPYWSSRPASKKGTGLGLYITRGIVEAHGGRLWVESRPGEGARFSFTVPLASGEAR